MVKSYSLSVKKGFILTVNGKLEKGHIIGLIYTERFYNHAEFIQFYRNLVETRCNLINNHLPIFVTILRQCYDIVFVRSHRYYSKLMKQ